MKYLIVAIVAVLAVACHDGCTVEAMRCRGNKVEICNSETDWERSVNCSTIEPADLDWTCCLDIDGLHACLPADECPVGGDQ